MGFCIHSGQNAVSGAERNILTEGMVTARFRPGVPALGLAPAGERAALPRIGMKSRLVLINRTQYEL